jgi:hypothetical protein
LKAQVSNLASFKNPSHNDTAYIIAWRDFMSAHDMLEDVQRLGPDVEVYSRRLLSVEWQRGGDWEQRLKDMMGPGTNETKLWRLFHLAKARKECCNNNGLRGWKLT